MTGLARVREQEFVPVGVAVDAGKAVARVATCDEKGPSTELIVAIVEMKRRNPKFGCVRIAQQIAHLFGVDIDKDVVRRVPAKQYGAALDNEQVGAAQTHAHRGFILHFVIAHTQVGIYCFFRCPA